MEYALDTLEPWVIQKFEEPARKIPMREKHFNTAMAVTIALIFSHIPLIYGTEPVETLENTLTFRVMGTWMQLGTQPFVSASLAAGFLFKKGKELRTRSRVLGLIFAVIFAIKWTITGNHHWFCTLQLCMVSYGLLQLITWLDMHGSVNFSTALIFAHASENIVSSVFSLSGWWAISLILLVTWLNGLDVTVPLTHKKYRSQTTSMPLPVLYNSTSALIIYSTVIEALSTLYRPAAVLAFHRMDSTIVVTFLGVYTGIYFINKLLPSMEDKTGRHLIENWKKEGYTMKGWRSDSKMATHVQKIIDRNIYWNTVILCALWSIGTLLPPAANITTLFILSDAAKTHVSQSLFSLW
jgi:preprotein translocase subunit SecY